jgi:hypothetical protein
MAFSGVTGASFGETVTSTSGPHAGRLRRPIQAKLPGKITGQNYRAKLPGKITRLLSFASIRHRQAPAE